MYAYEAGLIDRPIRLGRSFKRPSAACFRRQRAELVTRLFTPDDIHALLNAAGLHMKAFILPGINAALGPGDIGRLEPRHIEPLPKSGTWAGVPTAENRGTPPGYSLAKDLDAIEAALARQGRPRTDEAASGAGVADPGLPACEVWASSGMLQGVAHMGRPGLGGKPTGPTKASAANAMLCQGEHFGFVRASKAGKWHRCLLL